ncbi:MAG: HDOD domain-containing protein [Planctomycetota bacterium]|jgi:putative nucleotidyltransferase with HDIG domain
MTNSKSKMEIRRRVLQDTDQIPPLPEVIVRVLALLNEPETQPDELEAILSYDHVLVARLLAMVNSPFYGMRREVRTIKEAIIVLGYQNLRSMVMITSTSQFMRQDFECYGHDEKGLWRHSVSVAAGTRELATLLGEDQGLCEELFVAALLHDIGKMVLSKYLSQTPLEQIRGYRLITEAEKALVGVTHVEAGDLIAGKWNLSPVIHSVIANHHENVVNVPDPRPVAMARLANALAHELGTGFQEGHAPRPDYRLEDLACLGLDMEQWADAKERLREAMELAVNSIAAVYS